MSDVHTISFKTKLYDLDDGGVGIFGGLKTARVALPDLFPCAPAW